MSTSEIQGKKINFSWRAHMNTKIILKKYCFSNHLWLPSALKLAEYLRRNEINQTHRIHWFSDSLQSAVPSLSGDDSKQYHKRHKRIRDRFRGTHSDHFRLEAGVLNYYWIFKWSSKRLTGFPLSPGTPDSPGCPWNETKICINTMNKQSSLLWNVFGK